MARSLGLVLVPRSLLRVQLYLVCPALNLSVRDQTDAFCERTGQQGTITLHHTVIVALLSHLPYISTLAGMNSLTSYEVLGPAGVLFLQAGMIVKSLFTLLLWALCLFAFFVGQLPPWTGLQFRQANCFKSTNLVVWLVPVRPGSGPDGESSSTLDLTLIVSYTLFWFLVLAIGSYWTLIAPYVLVKRGGHLRDPRRKKIKGFPLAATNEPAKLLHLLEGEDRAFAHSHRRSDSDDDYEDAVNSRGETQWQGHPGGYKRDPDMVRRTRSFSFRTSMILPKADPLGPPNLTGLAEFDDLAVVVQVGFGPVFCCCFEFVAAVLSDQCGHVDCGGRSSSSSAAGKGPRSESELDRRSRQRRV